MDEDDTYEKVLENTGIEEGECRREITVDLPWK